MANSALEDWDELEKEYENLEEIHKQYCKKVEEVKDIQKKCMSNIAHQRYRIKQLSESIKTKRTDDTDEKHALQDLQHKILERKNQFRELEETLPHENGVYLKIILGSVNVSLLSKHDKYKYKEDYELFKLYVTIITMLMAVVIYFFVDARVVDAVFQFLTLWYYCTLTIREHILKVNGSRIKGWWVTHHFISTVCSAILLIWPDGETYKLFRPQFVLFSMYISLIQLAQYYYQRGCLYRLRSLGEKRNMDVTVEGFQSWMWKGLSYLLPFLIGGYIFQLSNAYVLYNLSYHKNCTEWQVPALAFIFFTLFAGNMITTISVVRQKFKFNNLRKSLEYQLKNKYKFNNNKVHTT